MKVDTHALDVPMNACAVSAGIVVERSGQVMVGDLLQAVDNIPISALQMPTDSTHSTMRTFCVDSALILALGA